MKSISILLLAAATLIPVGAPKLDAACPQGSFAQKDGSCFNPKTFDWKMACKDQGPDCGNIDDFGVPDKPSALDQVKSYAAAHHARMTVRKWNGNYWVEVDGLDPCGTGPTVEEAAREFMEDAKMMDSETNAPTPRVATPFVCDEDQECI